MSASERTALLSDNPYGSMAGETSPRPASNLGEGPKPKNVAKELGPNIVPQRTSRTSQKLKLLPDQLDYTSIDSSVDKSYSLQKITDRPARKDAERLGKKHRSLLPRVTAYCTAGSYKMRDLIRWLKDRKRIHGTMPKLFDECIYTPFAYKDWRSNSSSSGKRPDFGDKSSVATETIRLDDEGGEIDVGKHSTDVFIFEYGVVVLWGFNEREENAFLVDLAKFENEKLADEDVQAEEFNYYITHSYQPRIYNDFITLRDDSNYMLKLSISYAISQSVKISLFEELVDNTIEDTQDIPQQIAQTGKVEMTREEIMKSIGELFILRININLHGSVLDSPELMWSEPQLEPIYQATRGYMEINQRVALLNQRLEVISDLLQMLKEQLGHSNDEYLEFIVIMLIGAEVIVSIINIIVDVVGQRLWQLLWKQVGVNVWQDTTLGDGDRTQELVKLLIVSDSQQQVSWNNSGLLVVSGSVTSQLQDFSSQVLQNSSQVDWSTGTNSLSVVTLSEQSVDSTNWESQTSLRRSGDRSLICGTCFTTFTTGHFDNLKRWKHGTGALSCIYVGEHAWSEKLVPRFTRALCVNFRICF